MARKQSPIDESVALEKACGLHARAADLLDQGRLEEAESSCRRSLRILERHVGASDPDTLGMLYQSIGKNAAAARCYRSALGILQQSLGRSHPKTEAVLRNYASLGMKE